MLWPGGSVAAAVLDGEGASGAWRYDCVAQQLLQPQVDEDGDASVREPAQVVDFVLGGHAIARRSPLDEASAQVEAPSPWHDAVVGEMPQLVALDGGDSQPEGVVEVGEPLGVEVAVGDEPRPVLCDPCRQHSKVTRHLQCKRRCHIVYPPGSQRQVVLRIEYENICFQTMKNNEKTIIFACSCR